MNLTKAFLVCSLLLLSACGFKPMYGTHSESTLSTTGSALSQIQIANIPDRNGQILRNTLVDRMNPSGLATNPQYRLEVTDLEESVRDLDITIRSDTTRQQMKLTADMKLIDVVTNEIVLEKDLTARGSYNILESEYTSRVSRQDLRNDLLKKIAIQAERYISLHLSTQ